MLNKQTPVIVQDSAFMQEAYYLENQILNFTGISVIKHPDNYPAIILSRSNNESLSRDGAYQLEMSPHQIRIIASNKDGMFYGVISLLQMISKSKQNNSSVSVPCWDIEDGPLYQWRGFMLDESRHFFGKEVVKEILNQMAWLKLNRFHWHLTDEPGWRLQIKRYPKLALIGGIGNDSDSLAPAKYYTQSDIREIVAYANKLHIKVIPEIDMPGHATAANRAYHVFSGGGTGKFASFTFNPGKEGTYHYLTNILREVSVLFPSGMIHLGGDEVSFGSQSWSKDSDVQKLMQLQHLENLNEVEQYFFQRMTDSALTLFNKVLAWDEAADDHLPKGKVIIFWWRQDKPEQLIKALNNGYDVVLCPRIPFYFDFVQDSTDVDGRRWQGDFSSLEKVYNFSLRPFQDAIKRRRQVAGIQADLWTETVQSKKRLEFLLFPRITALSESAWTNESDKNYVSFLDRLKQQLSLYKKEGIYYYNPFTPEKTPEVVDGY